MTNPAAASLTPGTKAGTQVLAFDASRHFSPRALRDFELVQRILAHQEAKAYTELLDYYRQPVYHLIYRMVPQVTVAEDLTMEVLARACRYLPSFQPTFAFSTWLFRIATNYCIDFLRRRRLQTVSMHATLVVKDGEISFVDLPDAAPTPQEALIRKQRNQHLRRAVAQLPPRYKRVVEMHYFEELSCEEIATQQGLPVGTVKGHLHRCRELLARQLASALASI